MKIDINAHILPVKFKEALYEIAGPKFYLRDVIETLPTLFDLDIRFRIMDKYEGLKQVLTLALPPIEAICDPQQAVEMAKLANDEMAEIVAKHPDRFLGAAVSLPMNNMDEAMKELERGIEQLKMCGVQLLSPVNDKPLDSPEFLPIYEKMAEYDLPIWIHPTRTVEYADYKSMKRSMYMLFSNFGWPYETSTAMTHLVFAGILEKYPNLKIITHHCGGMVPFFEERIIGAYDHAKQLRGASYVRALPRPPVDYFRMFYADTAVYGSTPALTCGLSFFGIDRMVFGTDMPFDSELGDRYTRQTIDSIERMSISDADKKKIYEDTPLKLLGLKK